MLATLNVKDVAGGNGLNTHFPFTFTPIDTATGSDIELWLTDPSGTETKVTTSYSIDLVNSWVVYPTPASMPPLVPVATGWTVTVKRTEPFTQLIELTSQGSFDPAVLEASLDKVTALCQQINDYVNSLIAAGLAGAQATVFLNNLNTLVSEASANASAANLSAIAAAASEAAAAAFSLVALASQAEAEAGANNVHYMSALRTLQALSKSGLYMVPIANLPVGTTANKLIKLDGSAKIPALDGSLITDLPGQTFALTQMNVQVFTSSGNFSKPVGVSEFYVEVVGGGGGGASSTSGGIGGTGNTSSFGAFCQATGGVGGKNAGGVGGEGGVGSGGDLNLSGAPGGTKSGTLPGIGGGSFYAPSVAWLTAGVAYGGGGGGGFSGDAGGGGGGGGYCNKICTLTTDVTVTVGTGGAVGGGSSGAGADGVVIVRWTKAIPAVGFGKIAQI